MSALAFPKPEPRKPPLRAGQHRRTWIRTRRARRLDTAQSDPARLQWCREQPCQRCGRESTEEYPTQACHEGRTGKGMSTKCIDGETFPLCWDCHRQWTDGQSTNGFARHWNKTKRREWADEQVALATSRYLSHGARRSA